MIKVPIQPVNKLLSRVGRSHSSQLLTNLEIDENEQLTFLKLFGTKSIEKNSAVPSVVLLNSIAIDSSGLTFTQDSNFDRRNSLAGFYNKKVLTTPQTLVMPVAQDETNKSMNFVGEEPKKKHKISKSNSTIGFNLKKHLLKFARDKDTTATNTIKNESVGSSKKSNGDSKANNNNASGGTGAI